MMVLITVLAITAAGKLLVQQRWNISIPHKVQFDSLYFP